MRCLVSFVLLTDVEREFAYVITLMEALESVETNGNYVVTEIYESEMSNYELLARLPFAL